MDMRLLPLAPLCLLSMISVAGAEELRVLAAGSLREVMTEIGERYKAATGITVTAEFGPSGLLRERIEKGDHADLFASADMGHPLKLLRDGRATRAVMFTRNTLCGIAVPRVGLTTANFLDRLLDPTVKLGTSTPKADPSGDYTWTMFRRADALRPGSYEILSGKAQQIVGGPSNNAPVDGKDPAVAALAAGRVDIVIGYCTAPSRGCRRWPSCRSRRCHMRLQRGPNMGSRCSQVAVSNAADLALFMLSPEGQQIFSRYGFAPIALPASER